MIFADAKGAGLNAGLEGLGGVRCQRCLAHDTLIGLTVGQEHHQAYPFGAEVFALGFPVAERQSIAQVGRPVGDDVPQGIGDQESARPHGSLGNHDFRGGRKGREGESVLRVQLGQKLRHRSARVGERLARHRATHVQDHVNRQRRSLTWRALGRT